MKTCEKASWNKIEILQGRGRCGQQKDREIPYTRQTGYNCIHHFSCYFCGFCVDRNVLGEWKVERWIGWEFGTADSFFQCAWENKKGLQKHNYDITSIWSGQGGISFSSQFHLAMHIFPPSEAYITWVLTHSGHGKSLDLLYKVLLIAFSLSVI